MSGSLGSQIRVLTKMGSSNGFGLTSINAKHLASNDQRRIGTLSSISHSNGYHAGSGGIGESTNQFGGPHTSQTSNVHVLFVPNKQRGTVTQALNSTRRSG